MAYRNWDGNIDNYLPTQFPIVRDNIPKIFLAIQNLMKEKTTAEMFFTIFDPRFDNEEYDTEWSHIEMIVKSKQEKIFYFLRKAVYYDEKKNTSPCTNEANTLIKELQHFCGITTVEQESEGETLSAKEMNCMNCEALAYMKCLNIK